MITVILDTLLAISFVGIILGLSRMEIDIVPGEPGTDGIGYVFFTALSGSVFIMLGIIRLVMAL